MYNLIPYQPRDAARDHPEQVAEVHLYVSADRGKTWQLYEAITPDKQSFTFVAKKNGEYWFAPRVKKKDGTLLPGDVSELAPTQRVAVGADGDEPPTVPLRPLARPRTAADTADELDDELTRVELDLIRKEIKKLTALNSLTPDAEERFDRLRQRLRLLRDRDRDPLVAPPAVYPQPGTIPSVQVPPADDPRIPPALVPEDGAFVRPSRITPPEAGRPVAPPPRAPAPR